MRFDLTADLDLVREVMTHPKLYPWLSDDFSPPREDFYPPIPDGKILYVTVQDGDKFLGIFMFVIVSPVMLQVHTCLLPNAWGNRAAIAAREVATWIFERTSVQRIITSVCALNRLALRFARHSGMVEYGRNPNAVMKGGKLRDEILLGLSRPEGL